jgi:hypothetical protein
MQREGVDLLRRRYPQLAAAVANHPARRALARLLERIAPDERRGF